MKPTEEIGTRLRALRLRLGLTLCEAAERAGMNKGSLLHIERGDRRIPPRSLGRLVKVLGPEVLELARPGQLRLALDWRRATRRPNLDAPARAWLCDVAQVSLNGNAVEVFELPGPVLVLSALGPDYPPTGRKPFSRRRPGGRSLTADRSGVLH